MSLQWLYWQGNKTPKDMTCTLKENLATVLVIIPLKWKNYSLSINNGCDFLHRRGDLFKSKDSIKAITCKFIESEIIPGKSLLRVKPIKWLNQQSGFWGAGSDLFFATNLITQCLFDTDFLKDLNNHQNGVGFYMS